MAIRNLIVPRTISAAVASEVTLRIVGEGPDPLLASDCEGDVLPVIVIEFGPTDASKSVPIPVAAGFTAIGKGFRATLSDPSPAATLPAAVSGTVGYEAETARTAFYTDPVFAEPMYS